MKNKFFILSLLILVWASCQKKEEVPLPDANTITVPGKNTALINKLTATWCAPCGSWGWLMNEELTVLTGDKAIMISTYNSPTSLFFSQVSVDLANNFRPYQGWPTFFVNGKNKNAQISGGISYSGTKTACLNAANDFAELIPLANTGFVSQFKGNQLSVFTKTVFFRTQDTDEQFYLAAYLIENNVMGEQNGKPGEVPHPHVLRAGMTENAFGIPIDIEAIADNEFTYTFTTTPDPDWKRENLYVITVIWRKMGDTFEFVNASRG
jgi:hypothetical protein